MSKTKKLTVNVPEMLNILPVHKEKLVKSKYMSNYELSIIRLPLNVGESIEIEIVNLDNETIKFEISRTDYLNYSISPSEPNLRTRVYYNKDIRRWSFNNITGTIQKGLYALNVFYFIVEKLSQYPFVVTDKYSKTNGKDGIDTIVYLGEPPTDGETPIESIHDKPKFGYKRKPFYRTLKSKIYEKHPMYKVPKVMMTRSPWIGPKTYRTGKFTYKLWEPIKINGSQRGLKFNDYVKLPVLRI